MNQKVQTREKYNGKLRKSGRDEIDSKRWQEAQRHNEKAKLKALNWLLGLLAFIVITTMGFFLLQGFGWRGFHLSENTLHWLGGATVGQTVGIAGAVLRLLFR